MRNTLKQCRRAIIRRWPPALPPNAGILTIATNHDNYHVYGKEAIEMFFHHKFTFRILSITDPVIESETSANFLVCYSGTYLYARATIECATEDGLIQELTVRPA